MPAAACARAPAGSSQTAPRWTTACLRPGCSTAAATRHTRPACAPSAARRSRCPRPHTAGCRSGRFTLGAQHAGMYERWQGRQTGRQGPPSFLQICGSALPCPTCQRAAARCCSRQGLASHGGSTCSHIQQSPFLYSPLHDARSDARTSENMGCGRRHDDPPSPSEPYRVLVKHVALRTRRKAHTTNLTNASPGNIQGKARTREGVRPR